MVSGWGKSDRNAKYISPILMEATVTLTKQCPKDHSYCSKGETGPAEVSEHLFNMANVVSCVTYPLCNYCVSRETPGDRWCVKAGRPSGLYPQVTRKYIVMLKYLTTETGSNWS